MAQWVTKLKRTGLFRLPTLLTFPIIICVLLVLLHHQLNYHDIQPTNEEINRVISRRTPMIDVISESMQWNCTKYLSLLTPSMGPFKAWREYKLFKELFHSTNRKSVPQLTLSCPIQRCHLIVGATLRDKAFLTKSDGVVINIAPNLLKNRINSTVTILNAILRNDVTWFFLGMESPEMYTYWDADISSIYSHHEIAYHSYVSLSIPYGYFVPSNPMESVSRNKWANLKTHLVAWMASNCENTFWPRTEFVYDLQNYITIDIYGKCGNLTCLPPMSSECNNMLNKYKFYLALENTECDEYVTEKLWENSLKQNVVPVVYGGRKSAYENILPPNSFIHVGDFATTHELANYLLELDKDDEQYNRFFHWRSTGHVKTNYPPLKPSILCNTIPFLDSKYPNAKRQVSQSKYFSSCRQKPRGLFANSGSYDNWSPWK